MPLKKRIIKWPKFAVTFDAVSYRLPLPVKEIIVYQSGDQYPRCPRCEQSIDREYMLFCDRCGQRLDWCNFTKEKVHEVVP